MASMEGSGSAGEEASRFKGGTIDLRAAKHSSSSTDLSRRVHLLPCTIKHDGPAEVSDYFKPRNTDMVVDGLEVREAFFRGRRLHGATIPIPEGYRGFVLGRNEAAACEDLGGLEYGPNYWESTAEFGELTYWNHDTVPSQQDLLPRAFNWFSISHALHKPVTAEDLASYSLESQKINSTVP